MNALPRRSARLSQLHQQQSPTTSLPSSSPSASVSPSFPSPADDFAQDQTLFRQQMQSQYLAAPQHFNAPLPSPSAHELNSFFGFAQPQQSGFQMASQSQQNAQQSHQQHNLAASDKTQQYHATEHHNSFSSSQQQQPNIQPGNNPGQLPADFLAEAARRAQIACLMRDMGDVTL